jgi:hypothetical protein
MAELLDGYSLNDQLSGYSRVARNSQAPAIQPSNYQAI